MAGYLVVGLPSPVAVVHAAQFGHGEGGEAMWLGDDLGSVRCPLEGAGMDGGQRNIGQVLGCGLGLHYTLVGEGQVYDAPKALTLARADVPGGAAMADEDNSDHVTSLPRDADIVVCLG
jgi:hypothetical protein